MKCIKKIINLISFFLLIFLITLSAAFAGDAIQSRVTTQWVSDNINSIKIVDLRYKKYTESHIPTAMPMKWGTEVYDQDSEYRLPPNLSETKRVLDMMGLTPKDHIVLYDDDANMQQVMRMYWALKYWNFPKVSVIKGGWALWEKEDRPLADLRIAKEKKK
jgi:3-mercaptopyruvate sulfurtransferase SseA